MPRARRAFRGLVVLMALAAILAPAGSSAVQTACGGAPSMMARAVRDLSRREPLGWDADSAREVLGWIRPGQLAGMERGMAGMMAGIPVRRIVWTLLLAVAGLGLLQRFVIRRRTHLLVLRIQRILTRRISRRPAGFIAAIVGTILPSVPPFLLYAGLSLWRATRSSPGFGITLAADFFRFWTILRLLLSGMREAMGRRVLGCPRGPARYLAGALRGLVGFSLVAVTPLYLAGRLGAPKDQIAFLWFVYRSALVVLITAVLLRKSAVMAAFPDSSSRLYRGFVRFLSGWYFPALLLTLIVALLHLAGYRDLGTFVWRRTWAVAAVFLGLVALDNQLVAVFRAVFAGEEEEEGGLPRPESPARDFQDALVTVLRVAEVFTALWIVGDLVALRGPIIRFAATPMLSLGTHRVSAWLLLEAGAVVLVFVLAARLIRGALDYKLYPSLGVDAAVANAINTGLTYFLVLIGALIAMKTLGLDLRGVAIFAGALGVGVGFGLQNIVNNLVSGLTLVFGRTLKRGDWVTVSDQLGRVEEIGMRSTKIRSRDNVEFLVPNSEFLQTTITNWTFSDPRARFHIPFGVAYSADPAQVRKILLRAAIEQPGVLASPAPDVWFSEYGDSALIFTLLIWIDVRTTPDNRVRSDLYFRCWEDFKAAGIEIPFPQRDLHFRSGWPKAPADEADGGKAPREG